MAPDRGFARINSTSTALRGVGLAAGLAMALVLAACTSSEEPTAIDDGTTSTSTSTSTATSTTGDPSRAVETAAPTDPDTDTDSSAPAPARRVEGPPAVAGGNWISIQAMSSTAIDVIWSDVVDSPDLVEALDVDTVIYRLHRTPWFEGLDRDQVTLGADNMIYEGTQLGFIDTGLEPSGEYTYFVVLEDGAGQVSAPRWRDGAAIDDSSPPTTVTGFRAELDSAGLLLSWDPSSDDYRFAQYTIHRSVNGSPMEYHGTAWTADQTSFIDDDITPGDTIRYEIEAVDFHGNTSPRTTIEITT